MRSPMVFSKLLGRRLDERLRCPDVQDDQIFAARDAEEAVRIVVERLDDYEPRHQGFRRKARVKTPQ